MAVRTDLTVYWNLSPRIIEIAAPSVSISMQDLVDTCRNLESDLNTLDNDHLIDASGKESLGGNVYVGITVVLNNAKLKFEARLGPTWTLCDVAGGNLVALDENGTPIDSIEPSAYVTVTRTSSSSATLVEQAAIQHSSFSGAVWIDVVNGTAGTDFPAGTPLQPVDNLDDAKTIASARGFRMLCVIGDITFGVSDDIDGYIIAGESEDKTTVSVIAGCSTEGTEFEHVTLSGTLSGETEINNAHLLDVDGLNSHLHDVVLRGDITLSGADTTDILNSHSGVPGNLTPEIDMGGAGQSLGLRAYTGGIKIANFVGAGDSISLDFISGQAIIDSTCTDGTIVVRGVAKLTDNSGAGCIVDSSNLVNPFTIADQVWGELESGHTISGSFGVILAGLEGIDSSIVSIETKVDDIYSTVSGIDISVELIRDAHWNKKVLTRINDNEYTEELYDDAGLVVIRTHTLTKVGDVETRE